ncbi:MAG: hypothetical protein Q9202_002207 [Teloschistes flavicans]
MCWRTAWLFQCNHIWTVQSGACAYPFTPSCKPDETRTVIPELCRNCRTGVLLQEAQAPVGDHDDVIVEDEGEQEEEEEEGGVRGKGKGKGKGKGGDVVNMGRERERESERCGLLSAGRKGWLKRIIRTIYIISSLSVFYPRLQPPATPLHSLK